MPGSLVKLRLIPYNLQLVHARKNKGWTQKELAQLIGIHPSQLGSIETLRVLPSHEIMVDIATALEKPVEFLFPEELIEALRQGVFDHRIATLGKREIMSLTEARKSRLLPMVDVETLAIEVADRALFRERMLHAVDTLKPREREVIKMRFGLDGREEHTQREVGEFFNLTKGRIYQIEQKALRRLRHPSRSRLLKEYL